MIIAKIILLLILISVLSAVALRHIERKIESKEFRDNFDNFDK